MKAAAAGRVFRCRSKHEEDISFPSSEVSEGTLAVWQTLPCAVKLDPSLATIRLEHEKLHGEIVDEEYPLPYESAAANDEHRRNTATSPLEVTNIKEANSSSKIEEIDTNTVSHPESHPTEGHRTNPTLWKWLNRLKICVLVLVWVFFTYLLMVYGEKELESRQMVVLPGELRDHRIHETPRAPRIGLYLKGAFYENVYGNATNFLYVYVEILRRDGSTENITSTYSMPLIDSDVVHQVEETINQIVFHIGDEAFSKVRNEEAELRIQMYTNTDVAFPLRLTFDPSPINKDLSVIYAAIIFLGLYVQIIFELVHRTFAAIIMSTLALSVLAAMHQRPTLGHILAWIDVEILLLLFGMTILVAILSKIGIFDYLAITNGRVWPLITTLAFFTAILSAFLDNVTTILLMTPVTIRLCEVMGIKPVKVLMIMVIYSNVGGALTPVGDPPNIIIFSRVSNYGIDFITFTAHMTAGGVFVLLQTFLQVRFRLRNMKSLRCADPRGIQQLRQEIDVWQRTATTLTNSSRDEDLVRQTILKKVDYLERQLKKLLTTGKLPDNAYKVTLEELQKKYFIRNKKLLIQSVITLLFTVILFFLHAAPDVHHLSLGWAALIGAILLLILADRKDIENVVAHVEWTTLNFFAALFVLVEALAELGLIGWIGDQVEHIIRITPEDARLAVAILLILWVSAIASAFVDNIPLATMMLRIVISLGHNRELDLPLFPLVWALAFGASLGGNGTLIGASANLVCAGVAQQHGYKITFNTFIKFAFPIMIGHVMVATAYLMIAHVWFSWHY